MSLLNEALRKNRSERLNKVIADYSFKESSQFKKSWFIVILIVCAFTIGGLFSILLRQDDPDYQVYIPEPQRAVEETVYGMKQEPLFETQEPNKVQQGFHVDDPVKDQADDTDQEIPLNSVDIEKVSMVDEPAEKDENRTKEIPTETVEDNDEDVLYRKATQFHKQGKFEKAITMYRDVLRHNPQHAEALFNLASVYIKISDFSHAYDILIKLIAMTPDDVKTMLNLGITEIGLGKNRDALNHLSIVNNHEDEDVQFSLFFHRGIAMSRLGKLDEALVCYKEAENIHHDHTTLIFNMGVLYDKLGDYSKAINYYSRLLEDESLPSDETDKLRYRVEILQSHVSGSN